MEKFVLVEQANMAFKTKLGSFVALKDINLSIRQGEFVSLIGHSGCGKSTLLNMVAGLLQPASALPSSTTTAITSYAAACSNSCTRNSCGRRRDGRMRNSRPMERVVNGGKAGQTGANPGARTC